MLERAGVRVRARIGLRPCISSSPCSSGRWRGSTTRRGSTSPPDRSSLWAGLFDLRENLLGRDRRRPPRARRVALSAASSADGLTERCQTPFLVKMARRDMAREAQDHRRRLDQPRPRRALRAAAAAGRDGDRCDIRARSRAGRARTRRSLRAARRATSRWSAPSDDDAAAEDALAGLREAGVTLRLEQGDEHDRRRADPGRRDGRERRSSSRQARTSSSAAVELPDAEAVLCQLEIPDDGGAARPAGRRPASSA